MRLHLAGVMLLLLTSFGLLNLPPAFAQEAKEVQPQEPWTGTWSEERVMTRAELDKVLQAHSLWLNTNKKEGEQANLSGAKLYGVNLFHERLDSANLSKADLRNANLGLTRLMDTNLSGANLSGSNLSWARLLNTDLTGVDMSDTDLSYAIFIPKGGSLSNTVGWHSVRGLSTLRDYRGLGFQSGKTSLGLIELRETLKKNGSRDREREVTFSLNHNRRLLLEQEGFMGKMENLFHLICFELTCQYGMSPGRPLKIIGIVIVVLSLPYMLALWSRKREAGIWLLLLPDRVLDRGIKDRPYQLTTRTPCRSLPWGWRVLRIIRLGFYFSLLSAFSLGWRELNVGNWITRIQKREYTLRATGWVRTMAGVQSLLSVYLLALWVLTYFGRPFD